MSVELEMPGGKRLSISGQVTVGSETECEIRLADSRVQPRHAAIRRLGNRWLVEARDNAFLKVGAEQPGKMFWLQPGDIIRLGESGPCLTFSPSYASVEKAALGVLIPNNSTRLPLETEAGKLSDSTTIPAAATKSSSGQKIAATGRLILASVQDAAVLTAKHAQLKSLQRELDRAHEIIGVKAFDSNLGKDAHQNIYAEIRLLDAEISSKQTADPVARVEYLADKALRLAHDAKQKVEIENLLRCRQKCLRDLGSAIAASPRPPEGSSATLSNERSRATVLQQKIGDLTQEIEGLSRRSPRLWRRLKWAVAATVLSVAGYSCWAMFVRDRIPQSAETRRYLADAQHADEKIARLMRERAQAKAEEQARILADAKRRELEQVELAAEADKKSRSQQVPAVSGRTLDCSTEGAALQSIKRIMEEFSAVATGSKQAEDREAAEKKLEQFGQALEYLRLRARIDGVEEFEMIQRLHGMSADEVYVYARELEAQAKAEGRSRKDN